MNINILLITLLALTTHSYDWTPVDNIIQAVINVGGFPGAVLTIANATHTIYSNTYGSFVKATPPLLPPPMQQDTMFDIASLSKIAGTLGVIMQMVDTGLVTVNDLVIKYVPEYDNNGKSPTTLKNLLLHNAGLIPDYPGNAPDNKKQVMDWLYTCKLNYTIGTQYVYSDLSFILLAEIAERVLKKPLDVLVRDNLKRMEITNTMYNPDSSLHYKIAPTEYSGTYF
jgi:CubicO group peptidase (beta-lactamase class C family)